jgi:hypothetical protein
VSGFKRTLAKQTGSVLVDNWRLGETPKINVELTQARKIYDRLGQAVDRIPPERESFKLSAEDDLIGNRRQSGRVGVEDAEIDEKTELRRQDVEAIVATDVELDETGAAPDDRRDTTEMAVGEDEDGETWQGCELHRQSGVVVLTAAQYRIVTEVDPNEVLQATDVRRNPAEKIVRKIEFGGVGVWEKERTSTQINE